MNFNPFNLNNLFQQTPVGNIAPPVGIPDVVMEALGIPSASLSMGGPSTLTLAALFANSTLRLSPQDVSAFLKELLHLPDEMKMMLLLLSLESSPDDIKLLLKQPLQEVLAAQPLMIPIDQLQSLLVGKTQEAKEKLLKLLQGTALAQTQSGHQLAELTVSMTKLAEKVQTSPERALETLMLLYIPWYPLAGKQMLTLEMGQGQEGGEESAEDLSVVLFLETNTLGKFKICVQERSRLQAAVQLEYEEPAHMFISDLEHSLNDSLAKDGLPAVLFEATCVGEGFKPAPALVPENNQQITVQPSIKITFLVLHVGYTVARLIFEADEQNQCLRRNRQARI